MLYGVHAVGKLSLEKFNHWNHLHHHHFKLCVVELVMGFVEPVFSTEYNLLSKLMAVEWYVVRNGLVVGVYVSRSTKRGW
jgi:hypothetical protein